MDLTTLVLAISAIAIPITVTLAGVIVHYLLDSNSRLVRLEALLTSDPPINARLATLETKVDMLMKRFGLQAIDPPSDKK